MHKSKLLEHIPVAFADKEFNYKRNYLVYKALAERLIFHRLLGSAQKPPCLFLHKSTKSL